MAQIRFELCKEGVTEKDFISECMFLRLLLTEEEENEFIKRFNEYHGDTPDYDKMPAYKFLLENVEINLKK